MTEAIRKDAVASVLREQERQDYLDALYTKDGREAKDHPLYGLYTGLYVQEQAQESRS